MEPTTGVSVGNETVRNTRTSFLIHFFNVIQSFQKHTHASSHIVCGMWTGIESFKLFLNSIGKVEVLRSLFGSVEKSSLDKQTGSSSGSPKFYAQNTVLVW